MPKLAQQHVCLAAAVANRLTQHGLLMATAESCTGGGIGAVLTNFPGSSGWFAGGIISYSNSAKIDLLGVPESVLEKSGAVSQAVVESMALGGCHALKADICVAVSGIAGPDGGTPEKPVGSVWIAWAQSDYFVTSELYQFAGNRQNIREHTIEQALKGLVMRHLPSLLD